MLLDDARMIVEISEAMLSAAHLQQWEEVGRLQGQRQLLLAEWRTIKTEDLQLLECLRRLETLNASITGLATSKKAELGNAIQKQRRVSTGTRLYQDMSKSMPR